jgi:hypothetical protein
MDFTKISGVQGNLVYIADFVHSYCYACTVYMSCSAADLYSIRKIMKSWIGYCAEFNARAAYM